MNNIENHEEFYSLIENIIGGVCIFALDDSRNFIPLYMNEGFYRMMGYTHAELEKMLKRIRQCIIPDDLPVFEQGINDLLKDDGAVEIEFRTVTADGGIRWLQVRGNLYGKQDGYYIFSCIILDVTERKSVEEELAIQAERLNILSTSVKEHLFDYNSRTDVLNLRMDSAAVSKGEIVLKDFMENKTIPGICDEDQELVKEVLTAARRTPMSDMIEFRSDAITDSEEGQLSWYKATFTSVRGADGYVSRIVGRIVNIDEQKKKELELQLKADKDSLTGLYNKGAATQLISDAIIRCQKDNIIGALMMVDLDHFKSVNDTFGHAMGDAVIADAGTILDSSFKGRDIVGRMGGDEFMVFMEDIKGPEDALGIAAKLNKALTRTIKDSLNSVTVTASIGITICQGEGMTFQSVYEIADKALYETKKNGRDGRTLL